MNTGFGALLSLRKRASATLGNARSATNTAQFGAKEAASVAALAAASEAVMIALPPDVSDGVPAKTMAIANTPVATDKDRLAAAGEIKRRARS